MIKQRDLAILEKSLLQLYGPGLSLNNYAERSFALLGDMLETELTGLIIRDEKAATVDMRIDHEIPDLATKGEVFGLLAPKYPWFRADPSIHAGRVHCRSDFCSDRQFRDLDIHSEVFRGWGFQNFMSMYLHSEESRVVFFGFNRGRRDFSYRERQLVVTARPHLATARHLALALQASRSQPLTPELLSHSGFTPRESEVLFWLTEGKSNVEIAAILHLRLATVKGYVTAIFNKMGVCNRQAASLRAFELARSAHPRLAARASNRALVSPTKYPYQSRVIGFCRRSYARGRCAMGSKSDFLFFNQAVLELYAPGLGLETFAPRAFRFLAHFIETEVMVLALRNESDGVLTSTANHPLPSFDWAVQVYAQFGPSQPFSSYDPSVNGGGLVSRSDFCSRRQYRDLPLYTELFRHYGFINRMVIPVRAQPGRSLFISLSRGGTDFSARERVFAERAQAHLGAARHIAADLSASKPWRITPALLAGRGFTPRESEVLYWLTEGKSNIEIATILRIGLPTVKGYLMSIFNKTGTSNRLAATLHAVQTVQQLHTRQVIEPRSPLSFTVPFGQPPTKVG